MLDAHQIRAGEERSTRRPLGEAEVRALIEAVDEVTIARAGRAESRSARAVTPDDLRGPTGGFRAPIVRRGRQLLVGFHAATLERLL